MGINMGIITNELINVKSVEEKTEVFEKLSEAGLNPKDYKPADHDYVPFLLQISIDGELQNFLSIVNDHYDLVASVFRVLHPSHLEDLVSKYRNAYGIQKAKIETKMIAIGYIARNTTEEQQDAMISAFSKYEEERASQINAEKQKQIKLVSAAG